MWRVTWVLMGAVLTGCQSGPYVSARQTDTEIRQALAAVCPVGSSEKRVVEGLERLGFSDEYRLVYPATEQRPRVLLQRIFDNGGYWLESDDDLLGWVDASFVFSMDDRLAKTLLFRDHVRVAYGEVITSPDSPKRKPMKRPGPYPMPIPPPADPLEGAK